MSKSRRSSQPARAPKSSAPRPTVTRQARALTAVKGRIRQARKLRRAAPSTPQAVFANVGALTVGGAGVVLASAVGVGELAVGVFAAYVAYRVIRYGVAPTAAIMEGVELEHGELLDTMGL